MNDSVVNGLASEPTIEEARQELLEHAGLVCHDQLGHKAIMELADAYALAVHDETCIECHNADMRARCPRRRRLEALGG